MALKLLTFPVVLGIIWIVNCRKCNLLCYIPLKIDEKCGSNGITYQNLEELLCTKTYCVPDLYLAYNGRCKNVPNLLSSNEYHRKLTFGNPLELASENIAHGIASLPVPSFPKIAKTIDRIQVEPIVVTETYDKSNEISSLNQNTIRNLDSIKNSTNTEINSPCLENCACDFTLSPVCGSNEVTYGNNCTLECMQKCEHKLNFHHNGFCGRIFFRKARIPKLKFFRMYSHVSGKLI